MREAGQPTGGAKERTGAPAPHLLLFDTLDGALDSLVLRNDDRAELLERIQAMGTPDATMRERIGLERETLARSAERPLTRTALVALREPGEAPSAFVETFYLPSARLLQVRRRFPSMDEVEEALRGKGYNEPALWIREILLPPGRELASAEMVDAATVVSLPFGR